MPGCLELVNGDSRRQLDNRPRRTIRVVAVRSGLQDVTPGQENTILLNFPRNPEPPLAIREECAMTQIAIGRKGNIERVGEEPREL